MAKIVGNFPAALNGYKPKEIRYKSFEHWLEVRKSHTSGTDSSALLGHNMYTSEYAIYMEKTNQVKSTFTGNVRTVWGNRNEATIRDGIAEDLGYEPDQVLICENAYFCIDGKEKLGATVDAVLEAPTPEVIEGFGEKVKGAGIFEIKNVDSLIHKQKWINDEPPLQYILQIQHYMAVFGYEWAILGALVGGNTPYVYYYKRHEPTIKAIKKASIAFWQRVADNTPPPIDNSNATAETIKRQNGDVKELEADLTQDNELPSVCENYLKVKKEISKLDKEVRGYKSQIMAKLGENSSANVNGFYVKAPSKYIEAYTVDARTQRTLTVKERAE